MRTVTAARAPLLAEVVLSGARNRPGARYLAHLAGLALLLGLFERWDLLGGPQVVVLVAALMLVTVAGTAPVLASAGSSRDSARVPVHYLVPVMAVAVAAAVSYLIQDWRLHLASQALMAVAIFASSYVSLERFMSRERPGHEFLMNAAVILVLLGAYISILVGTTNLAARLVAVFVATGMAAYELLGRVAQEQVRAVVGSLFVAQLVTIVAFALLSVQFVDNSRLAGILLVSWYVNRDLARHLFEGTLTRNILAEYSIGLVLAAALIGSALLSR